MTNEDRVDLFTKPVLTTETPPRLADGRPPRGLTAAGWVRTTGWLQFGDRPVSSAHIAAVISLLWALAVAVALLASAPVTAGFVVLLIPVLCGAAWSFFTTRLRPASTARNTGTKRASELSPGDIVRPHGLVGPVDRVTAVTIDVEVRVDFHSGDHRSWTPEHDVQVAELLS